MSNHVNNHMTIPPQSLVHRQFCLARPHGVAECILVVLVQSTVACRFNKRSMIICSLGTAHQCNSSKLRYFKACHSFRVLPNNTPLIWLSKTQEGVEKFGQRKHKWWGNTCLILKSFNLSALILSMRKSGNFLPSWWKLKSKHST